MRLHRALRARSPTTVIAVAHELAVQHVVVGESPHPGVRGTAAPRAHRRADHRSARCQRPRRCAACGAGPAARTARRTSDPDSDALLRALHASASRAGLRVYLGYARGCGTTVAMLDEANRRHQRGTDVVVAAVKTDGRSSLRDRARGPGDPRGTELARAQGRRRRRGTVAAQPGGRVPRRSRRPRHRGATDHRVGAPSPARRDDADRDPPSHRHPEHRRRAWARCSGIRPHHVVDDSFLDQVTELEIVDVTPSVLDERLRRGEIVPASEAAEARARAFRPGGARVLARARVPSARGAHRSPARRLHARSRHRVALGGEADESCSACPRARGWRTSSPAPRRWRPGWTAR